MRIAKQILFIFLILTNLTGLAFAGPGGNGGPGGGAGGPGAPGSPSSHGPSAPPPSSPRGSTPSAPNGSSLQPPCPSATKLSTMSYNGMRLCKDHDSFQVVLIESTSESILVTFNIPVNPSSFKRKNIFINDEELDSSSEIRFNKTGKILEIKTKLLVGTRFNLEFKDAKSYDREKLTVSRFESLLPWTTTEYPVISSDCKGD